MPKTLLKSRWTTPRATSTDSVLSAQKTITSWQKLPHEYGNNIFVYLVWPDILPDVGSGLWLNKQFSCDISTETSFVFSHIVFPSYQSPPLQNTVLFHYTLNMLHKEYQDPLPQVFQVISFQLSSVICWEYYLENSFLSTSYDIHQFHFVLWNSVKHFYDFIFIHSSQSLQIFIFISLFLLLLWLINIGMWYDLYLFFWGLKII